mgnify:CR=1 FL=1
MNLEFNQALLTDVGLVRKANEDSIGFSPAVDNKGNGAVFVLCDGMGGHKGGTVASKTAVERIIEYFRKEYYSNPYIALNNAILFANEQIFLKTKTDPELKGMGTTCTVLLQRENEFYLAHVGDSRAYFHEAGELHRLTKDHSYVQKLVDSGIDMTEEEMESHPRKNEILRALGISSTVEVEVCSQPISAKKASKIILCSDGLCGLINDAKFNRILNENKNIDATAKLLIDSAKNAGGHDNISVIIVDVVNSPCAKSIFVAKPHKSVKSLNPIKSNNPDTLTTSFINYKKEIGVFLLFLICIPVYFQFFYEPKDGGLDNSTVTNIEEPEPVDVEPVDVEPVDVEPVNPEPESKRIPSQYNDDDLARQYYKKGDFEESIKYFIQHEQAIKGSAGAKNELLQLYLDRGKAYCMINKLDKAIADFDKIKTDNYSEKFIYLTVVYLKKNEFSFAQEAWQKAFEMNSGDIRVQILNVEILRKKNRKRQSCEKFKAFKQKQDEINFLEPYFKNLFSTHKNLCDRSNNLLQNTIDNINKKTLLIKEILEREQKFSNDLDYQLAWETIEDGFLKIDELRLMINDSLSSGKSKYKQQMRNLEQQLVLRKLPLFYYTEQNSRDIIIFSSNYNPNYFKGTPLNYWIGQCLFRLGKAEAGNAIHHFRQYEASDIFEQNKKFAHETYYKLAKLEQLRNNKAESKKWFKKACDLGVNLNDDCPECCSNDSSMIDNDIVQPSGVGVPNE